LTDSRIPRKARWRGLCLRLILVYVLDFYFEFLAVSVVFFCFFWVDVPEDYGCFGYACLGRLSFSSKRLFFDQHANLLLNRVDRRMGLHQQKRRGAYAQKGFGCKKAGEQGKKGRFREDKVVVVPYPLPSRQLLVLQFPEELPRGGYAQMKIRRFCLNVVDR